jgi:hypothetical protein
MKLREKVLTRIFLFLSLVFYFYYYFILLKPCVSIKLAEDVIRSGTSDLDQTDLFPSLMVLPVLAPHWITDLVLGLSIRPRPIS